MKKIFTLTLLLAGGLSGWAQTTSTFHEHTAITMSGDTVSMAQYYGKKVMVVNCATFCSYTPQYTPLQELYDQYSVSHNFEIIGFPTDDFLNQGGSDSEIIDMCETYGVTFPIMAKIHVNAAAHGNNVDPVFQWLEKISLNGVSNASVTWNFHKFLIDEAGHWIQHYGQGTEPDDPAIVNWILSPSVISSSANLQTDETVQIISSNPANSSIDFIFKNATPKEYSIHIFSSTGMLVGNVFEGMSTAQVISYPLSALSAGIYFAKVQSAGEDRTVRFAVAR